MDVVLPEKRIYGGKLKNRAMTPKAGAGAHRSGKHAFRAFLNNYCTGGGSQMTKIRSDLLHEGNFLRKSGGLVTQVDTKRPKKTLKPL